MLGNVVFVLGSFILFLLVFETNLVIPNWLKPVGRMHPLFLHFPIVLVLLAAVMECFRRKPAQDPPDGYERFSIYVLLGALITSGLTVIMGIFLAVEGGYDPASLFRHKWTGVIVFYLTVAMYVWRDSGWYSQTVARSLAVVTSGFLVFAGHFGATLTHGDNFVWQPVMASSPPEISPEEAQVFEHVVKPILDRKCVSCHNADKLKGKLKLTDSTSLLKGGKSGDLFVAGNPDESLMIERLELPVEEKKHMPPRGKPQLTREEHLLLVQWIKSGASFKKKIASLPETDTFRRMAMRFFEDTTLPKDVYDFPAIEERTLAKLNSDYRVVRPVAMNSPALAVNLYNQQVYSPRSLDELQDIKRQVISLHLSKMPVRDEDIRYMLRFENLERLNLNFSEVTGKGLETLTALKHLRYLSLAGTGVTYSDLVKHLPSFKSLSYVSLWDTPLTAAEIRRLQNRFTYLTIQGMYSEEMGTPIKLNPPRLGNKMRVFEDSIEVEIVHPVRDVDVRFTLDGSAPDSVAASRFSGSTIVRKTTAIQARAYKPGWLSSDPATLYVYRRAHTPDTAFLRSRLNRVHTAKGAKTFFDLELGSFNANSPAWANNWAGVIGNDLELLLQYDSSRLVSSVSLNTLIELETYLFPPSLIEVWGGPTAGQLRLIGRTSPVMPSDYRKPYIQLFDCTFEPARVRYLKIVAKPVMKLPGWHKRKGKPALLLVDEILVN